MLKNLLYITLLTFAIIVSWIAFGIYHSFTTSTISSDASILITPIPPRFDDQALERVKSRKSVSIDLGKSRSVASTTPTLAPISNIQESASGAAEL